MKYSFQKRLIIIKIGNSFTTTQYYFATWKSEDQKKIAKNSLSGLNRIYKPYSEGILITEAAFLINQYCISEQSISSLPQLQKTKVFFFSTTQ